MTTNVERRLAALEQRYRPTVAAEDRARMEATCRVLARELGIDEAELWDEAVQVAKDAARFPDHAAHLRHVAAKQGITVAELEAELRRIDAAATRELAGLTRVGDALGASP